MSYKYIDGISIADIVFDAEGSSLEGLFEASALATMNTMVKDLKAVKLKRKKEIKVESDSIENLLFNFLDDVIFYKDADQLLLTKFKIKITEKEGKYTLVCKAEGEKLNMKKHDLVVDVKAVTMHLFEVVHKNNKWKARVVLDI